MWFDLGAYLVFVVVVNIMVRSDDPTLGVIDLMEWIFAETK